MGQLQWRLWLVGATTFLLGNASGTASPSHSLLHFRHAVLLEGRPQFVEVTYLDSQPIQYYDSNTKKMRPLTPWMNQTLTEDYWRSESIMGYFLGENFLEEFQNSILPPKHHNQSMELPIVKVTHQEVSTNNLQALTCQAYGFYPREISVNWRKDGEIFNQTNSAAHIAPNSDGTFYARLSIQINPKKRKLYRCHVEHVSSSKPLDFILQEIGPSAKVTTRVLNVNDTRLNCSVCNFYPEDIEATWKKDGEFWDHEIYRGDTIRNWDGTYCTWISIEINPMEEDHYCCYVGHDGLQEPLCVKALKLEIPNEESPIFILYYTLPVLGILILGILGILCYKKCRRRDYKPAAKSDPNSSMDNAEKSPLKETEGIPPLNNSAGEESKGDSPPSQGIGEKKQPPENHQISV